MPLADSQQPTAESASWQRRDRDRGGYDGRGGQPPKGFFPPASAATARDRTARAFWTTRPSNIGSTSTSSSTDAPADAPDVSGRAFCHRCAWADRNSALVAGFMRDGGRPVRMKVVTHPQGPPYLGWHRATSARVPLVRSFTWMRSRVGIPLAADDERRVPRSAHHVTSGVAALRWPGEDITAALRAPDWSRKGTDTDGAWGQYRKS